MYQLAINLLVIAAEIALVISVFCLINFIFGNFFKKLSTFQPNRLRKLQIKRFYRRIQWILGLLCFICCLSIAIANGWLLYQGEDLQSYTYELFKNKPRIYWEQLAIAIAQSIGALAVAGLATTVVKRLLKTLCQRAKNFEEITANDESIEVFCNHLRRGICYAIWIFALIQCFIFLGGTAEALDFIYRIFRIYGIIVTGFIASKISPVIIDSLDALSQKYSSEDNWLRFYDQLRHLTSFIARSFEYAIYVTTVTFVVRDVEAIANWAPYGPKAVKIIGVILIARIFIEITRLIIEELVLRNQDLSNIERKRRRTIVPLLQSILRYCIYFGAAVSILYVLEIDPTPILAAAGLIGLAASLGAQNLINDIVSGFFILFENYYLVGDYIETGTAEGYVEAIELRTTRIRDLDGQQYIIRNGDVGQITNFSKQFIHAIVKVGVAYESDLKHVIQVIETVGRILHQQNSDVLAPTEVQGLDDFGESELVIRTITKVKPGKHIPVKRALRKLIKEAFDAEEIEIPFAQRVLIFKDDKAKQHIAP